MLVRLIFFNRYSEGMKKNYINNINIKDGFMIR